MNPVQWLQSLLPETVAISGWGIFLIVLSYLVCLALIMSLMKAAARADRRAVNCKQVLHEIVESQWQQANGTSPQVTAKTLIEEPPNDVLSE